MPNEPRTEDLSRAFERISTIEQAVSRMEAELGLFAENTAKQFEDFVRQVGASNEEWSRRLRDIQQDTRAESARIEKANRVPWLAILAFALTACGLAAGLVRYSLEARTRTLEVQQEAIEKQFALVKSAQEREIILRQALMDQKILELKNRIDKLKN